MKKLRLTNLNLFSLIVKSLFDFPKLSSDRVDVPVAIKAHAVANAANLARYESRWSVIKYLVSSNTSGYRQYKKPGCHYCGPRCSSER
jgi:hypothetical protein